MRIGYRILGALAVTLLVAGSPALAQTGATGADWFAYGADKGNTKYSPLTQINKSNFKDLEIAWSWESPDNEISKTDRRLTPFIHEVTPIIVDGVMYASTSFSQVAAIDPQTGKTLWVFDTKSYEAGRPTNLGFVHRGVSYWRDGDDERIFIGTGDMKLWSIDAKTGKPDPEFFDGQPIDLAGTMRRPVNKKAMQVSSPTVICRDVVVVGSSIFDGPTLKEMPPGDVRGYDAKTGKLLWTFHNPPLKGEFGSDTWKEGSGEYTGNGNVWTVMAADEELGYVYLPFGTPTNDWYGGHRKGNNLFAETLVCVDARTGKRVWHFQTTHHGVWDYDLPAGPALFDVKQKDGSIKKIVAQVTKQGFLFGFDRVTGEPLWPIDERAVPQSTAEGEETSATQPHPTKPAPFELQGSYEKDLIDFTPELREAALKIFAGYRTGPLFTPPAEDKPTIYNPGWGGGANWMGGAVDIETGIIYVPSQQGPISLQLQRPDAARSNFRLMGANQGVGGPKGLPLFQPPYGRITAIDMSTGDVAWMEAHGDGPIGHAALKDVDMDAYLKEKGLNRLGTASRAHPLVTKTLLITSEAMGGRGSAGGGPAANVRAWDKATGELIGELAIPESFGATPMTYEQNGKQYIVIASGGMGSPSKLVALSLP